MAETTPAQGLPFVWHEVYGANSQALLDFYTQALDFESEEFPIGDMGMYKMLVHNGRPVAGVVGTKETPEMEKMPAHWATYIGVADCDERVAKCLKLGATLLHGPIDVPTVGRMAMLQDPQGASFWLFEESLPD